MLGVNFWEHLENLNVEVFWTPLSRILQFVEPLMTCICSCINALKELLSQTEKPRISEVFLSGHNHYFLWLRKVCSLLNLSGKLPGQTHFQGTSNKVLFCPQLCCCFIDKIKLPYLTSMYLTNQTAI